MMLMSRLKTIRVFEYESVTYRGKYERKGFTEDIFKAFERYFQNNENTPFFKMIPYGVRFTQYVGAIQIGAFTIEVLPKAGRQENEKVWHNVLLDMLKTCNLLTAKESGQANLRLRSNSILDLYFELYIKELEKLIHQGLIKKYRKQEGQQKALKGAIVFARHISKNLVHKERFYTRHSVYDKQHLLHQVLFEALLIVKRFSNSSYLADRMGRVEMDFPEVNRLHVVANHFNKIGKGRKVQPYAKALNIAKLLILNYRPDISTGRNDLLAIMFDMNVLWEEYVFRKLKKELGADWNVRAQERTKFWEAKIIKPDIFLEHKQDENLKYIIDTKWKVIDNKHPADDDLKQMYVYNHHWGTYQSMLLYPSTNDQHDRRGKYTLPMFEQKHGCILGFVHVVDEVGLRKDLVRQIKEKLLITETEMN
jgi:5-methylcytosine-specific restriction enzyme subunit McrC